MPELRLPESLGDAEGPLRGVVVVVLDEDPESREAVTRPLLEAGAAVVAGESETAILRMASQLEIHAVVASVSFGQDRPAFVEELRAQAGHALPAVAVVGDMAVTRVPAGFQAVFPRPVDHRLVTVVAVLVGSARQGHSGDPTDR